MGDLALMLSPIAAGIRRMADDVVLASTGDRREGAMLYDIHGVPQAAIGTRPHWDDLIALMVDEGIYEPLRGEIMRIVDREIRANPNRPEINSRQAGDSVLSQIGQSWHDALASRFPHLAPDDTGGLFGMALWHYLATREEQWRFSGLADPNKLGRDAKIYWRQRRAEP